MEILEILYIGFNSKNLGNSFNVTRRVCAEVITNKIVVESWDRYRIVTTELSHECQHRLKRLETKRETAENVNRILSKRRKNLKSFKRVHVGTVLFKQESKLSRKYVINWNFIFTIPSSTRQIFDTFYFLKTLKSYGKRIFNSKRYFTKSELFYHFQRDFQTRSFKNSILLCI